MQQAAASSWQAAGSEAHVDSPDETVDQATDFEMDALRICDCRL